MTPGGGTELVAQDVWTVAREVDKAALSSARRCGQKRNRGTEMFWPIKKCLYIILMELFRPKIGIQQAEQKI
jgi:hypothetical protein